MKGSFPVAAFFALLLVLFVVPGACIAPATGTGAPALPVEGTPGTYDRSLPLLPNVSSADQTLTAQDWYEQGFALTNEGRYEDALLLYGKALSCNRSLLNAWYYMGDALFRLGRYNESILAFDNATEVDPDFVDAYFYESLVFEKLGRYQDRQDALQKGLAAADRKEAAEENQTAAPAGGPGAQPEPLSPVIDPLGIALAMGLRSLRRQEPDS